MKKLFSFTKEYHTTGRSNVMRYYKIIENTVK